MPTTIFKQKYKRKQKISNISTKNWLLRFKILIYLFWFFFGSENDNFWPNWGTNQQLQRIFTWTMELEKIDQDTKLKLNYWFELSNLEDDLQIDELEHFRSVLNGHKGVLELIIQNLNWFFHLRMKLWEPERN